MSRGSFEAKLGKWAGGSATCGSSSRSDSPAFVTGTTLTSDETGEAASRDAFHYGATSLLDALGSTREHVQDEGTRWTSSSTALAESVFQCLKSVSLVIASHSTRDHSEIEPSMILRSLKRDLGVNSTQLAKALGVSRRALYNWLEGQISDENKYKLEQVYSVLRPLVERRGPNQLRLWLTTDETDWSLLKEDSIADLVTRVNQALADPEIPLFRAHPIIDQGVDRPGSDVRPLSPEHRQQVLREFSRDREESALINWVPPELTDSVEQDDG